MATAGAGALPRQTPVFRAGVDLVTVEVSVLDKTGAPVGGLGPGDFLVIAGGRARRVVAADFVRAAPPPRSALARRAPAASSNQRTVSPRTIVLLIDVDQIPAGGGRTVMRDIAAFLDRLPPHDEVGIMTMTDAAPVAPTTDRVLVREKAASLVGTSMRLRDKEMSFAEAPGIARRDRAALLAYWSRIVDQGYAVTTRDCSPPRGFESTRDVPASCVDVAEIAMERARLQSTRILGRLRSIADVLAPFAGPKAIVLVSGGFLLDQGTRVALMELAAAVERARVSVHTMLIEGDAGAGTGSGNTTESRRLEAQVALAALSDVAAAGRGSMQRVPGEATSALARLDRELSGYYLLSFEREPTDREGERLDLDVRMTREDVTVRAGRGVTPVRPSAVATPVPPDLKAGVGALLRSGVPIGRLPVDVDTFALPVSEAGRESRVILAVDLGRDAGSIAALGFQIADATGRVVADGYEAPVTLQAAGVDRSRFVTTATLAPGRYVARVGAIDGRGERGSAGHAFEVLAWPAGPVRVSDVILGDLAEGDVRPGAACPASGPLGVRLVVRAGSSTFAGLAARAFVTMAGDDAPIEMIELPLRPTPDPVRRLADGALDITLYPPGEYLITAVVTSGATEIGRRTRLFVR